MPQREGEWREAVTIWREWGRALQDAGRQEEAFDALEQGTLLTIKNTRHERR